MAKSYSATLSFLYDKITQLLVDQFEPNCILNAAIAAGRKLADGPCDCDQIQDALSLFEPKNALEDRAWYWARLCVSGSTRLLTGMMDAVLLFGLPDEILNDY